MHLQNFGAMSAGTSERALLGTRRWCRRRSSALANQRTCCRCRNQSEERAGICTQMPQSVALVIASEPENRRQVLGLDSADEPRRLLRLRVWHVLVGWSCDLHQVRSQKVQGSTLHATTAEPGSTQKPALRPSALMCCRQALCCCRRQCSLHLHRLWTWQICACRVFGMLKM
jgi:hypothetical protein